MNSNDPFYPILIPNTPYVKFSRFFFLVVGGSQGVLRIFRYGLPEDFLVKGKKTTGGREGGVQPPPRYSRSHFILEKDKYGLICSFLCFPVAVSFHLFTPLCLSNFSYLYLFICQKLLINCLSLSNYTALVMTIAPFIIENKFALYATRTLTKIIEKLYQK